MMMSGRQHSSKHGHQRACNSRTAVADQYRGVHRYRSGTGLRYGRQVQHFLLLYPAQTLHKLSTHERHYDKAPAKSAGA